MPTLTINGLTGSGVLTSPLLDLRITEAWFVGSFMLRVELRDGVGALKATLLSESEMGRQHSAMEDPITVTVNIPNSVPDGWYNVWVTILGIQNTTGYTYQDYCTAQLTLARETITSNWRLFAQRPPAAVNSEHPGVIAQAGGVMYYLHEEAKTPADSAVDTMAFYKYDAGVWSELTGPAMRDAQLFNPVNAGDAFTGEWWRRVQAYNLGDGRIAFAGWVFRVKATYYEQTPDPYNPSRRALIHSISQKYCKRLVRVYTIATDSWEDFEDTIQEACTGSPEGYAGYAWYAWYGNGMPLPIIDANPAYASMTFTARSSDGKLWMAADGGMSARTWNPATEAFAATHPALILPWAVAYWYSIHIDYSGFLETVARGQGFFGWRDDKLEAGTDTVSIDTSARSIRRWNGSTWVWDMTSLTPQRTGWDVYDQGNGFRLLATDNRLAWTYCHNGDGVKPMIYGVRYTNYPSGLDNYTNIDREAHKAFRYELDVAQDYGLTDLLTTYPGANIYANAAGTVYLVLKTGIYWQGGGSGGGDVTNPTVHFHSPWDHPAQGETMPDPVSGAFDVLFHAEDDTELDYVRLYIAAGFDQPVGSSTTQIGQYKLTRPVGHVWTTEEKTDWIGSIFWNTTLWADGQYTLLAYVVDKAGNIGYQSINVTISNASAPADTTPPTVVITSPARNATVSGVVNISALCTDDVRLLKARLVIDGVQHGADVSLAGTVARPRWTVDTSTWANGAHTIQVIAWDTSNNQGSDSITITINNLLADQELVLYSVELPTNSPVWRLTEGKKLRSAKLDVITGALPVDPRQVYNVYPFWKQGISPVGVSGNPAAPDYTVMDPFSTRDVLSVQPTATALRFALVARPSFRDSYWEVPDAEEFFRILVTADDRVIAVTRTPARIYELSGAAITLLADLTLGPFPSATINEAVVADGKLLLATDQGAIAYDLDSSDQPVMIRLDEASFATAALAANSAGALIPQGGKLFNYTWPAPKIKGTTVPPGIIWADEQLIIAATTTPPTLQLWVQSGGTGFGANWQLAYTLGASEQVRRIFRDTDQSGVTDLWVACDGAIHRSIPSWVKDVSMTGSVRAFAKWRGYLWAAGTVGGLWYRSANGWIKYSTLPNVAMVHDMRVVNGRLYLAVRYNNEGTPEARIISLSVDLGGDFQCGPEPPDILPRAVDYLEIEVS